MKIVNASTQEQELEIVELATKFYRDIFPLYFSDDEIQKFEKSKVLDFSAKKLNYHGTMKEAFVVLACLQTLISILEATEPSGKYESLFFKNAQILNDYGIHFPFCYKQFTKAKDLESVLSIFTKATNQLLI